MFCTRCAAPNVPSHEVCFACGAELAEASPPPQSGILDSLRKQTVAAIPLVALALVLILVAGRQWRAHRGIAAGYDRATSALARGDYVVAGIQLADLGGFRDAETLRAANDLTLASYADRYRTARLSLDRGDLDDAISELLPIVRDLPDYRDASVVLEEARAARVEELLDSAKDAERAEDWMTVESMLSAALRHRPGDDDISARLAAVRRLHAPLVYTRDGDIFLGTPAADGERLLLHGKNASWATWSPDRARIAFVDYAPANTTLNGSLYVINADGSGLRELTTTILPYGWPSWSPDGSTIAYQSAEHFDRATAAGYIGLWIADIATGRLTDLTEGRFDFVASLSWAPDSRRIAFVDRSIRATGGGYYDIEGGDVQVMDVATGAVTDVTGGSIENEYWATWSPVDDRLVILTNPGDWSSDSATQLFVVDSGSGQITSVPVQGWRIGGPVWSPDGRRFAFVQGDDTVVVWTDGREEWVTFNTDVATQISWSPDGSSLFAPGSTEVAPSYVVDVERSFGSRAPVDIPFDTGSGSMGPPQWGARFPSQPDAGTSIGTALDS